MRSSAVRYNSNQKKLKSLQNKGARTAGVDGVKWTTPKAKMNAVLTLSDKFDKNPYRDMEYFDLRKAKISLCKKVNTSSNKRTNA